MSAIRIPIRLQSVDRAIARLHGFPRRLAPREERKLDDWGYEIIKRIRAKWPVDTGTSRAAWNFVSSNQPGDVSITLENPMHYSSFVHYRGSPKAKGRHGDWLTPSVYEELIPRIWAELQDRIVSSMIREVEITEKEYKRRQEEIGAAPSAIDTFTAIFHPWQEMAQ